MTDTEDRVRIWNSFFALAREEAKKVYEISENCKTKGDWFPRGGKLPDEALHKKVSKKNRKNHFYLTNSNTEVAL